MALSQRVVDLIARVRRRIGDPLYRKWDNSNDRILDLIDEACKDINIQTEIYQVTFRINVIKDTPIYYLPLDIIRIIRVEYESGKELPLIHISKIKQFINDEEWKLTKAEKAKYVVYGEHPTDQISSGFSMIRLYPIPTKGSPDDNVYIDVYYITNPPSVRTVEDIRLPTYCDKAIELYIAHEILYDFNDAEFFMKAKIFGEEYSRELLKIKGIASTNWNHSYSRTHPYKVI